MTVLVLGGTRFLGRRVVKRLLDEGFDVIVAHRGRTGSPPQGSAALQLDRASGEGVDRMRRLRPEAVVDLSGYRADWVREALRAVADRRTHYVFVSSGAVYQPSEELPWPESTPYGPMEIWGDYGNQKLTAERLLWSAQAEGAAAATVLRFPFILGPGNYADREAFVCSRICAGRPLLLPAGGTAINQFVHVEDAARAIVAGVCRPERSAGEAFNCGHAHAITNRGFVDLCSEVLGEPAETFEIDARELGVESEVVDLTDVVFPFPSRHYALDPTRLGDRLGVECRHSTRRAIEQFVSAWTSGEEVEREPRRYEREERALARLGDIRSRRTR